MIYFPLKQVSIFIKKWSKSFHYTTNDHYSSPQHPHYSDTLPSHHCHYHNGNTTITPTCIQNHPILSNPSTITHHIPTILPPSYTHHHSINTTIIPPIPPSFHQYRHHIPPSFHHHPFLLRLNPLHHA